MVSMNLRAHQSGYIVFRETSATATLTATPKAANPVSTLDGPWTVAFQTGRGAPAESRVMGATDWTQNPDLRIRYFSGTANYRHNLPVNANWLADG